MAMLGALGFLAGQAQGKIARQQQQEAAAQKTREQQIQQAQFDQTQALTQKQVDAEMANAAVDQRYKQAQIDKDAAETAAKNITSGVGVMLPPNLAHPLNHGKPFTQYQTAQNLRAQATYYAQRGAKDRATTLETQAKDLETSAHKSETDAIALKRESDGLIRTLAQIKHWGAQDVSRAQQVANQWSAAVMRGDTTIEVARERIASAANLENSRETAAMGRAAYNDQARAAIAEFVQGSTDARAQYGDEMRLYGTMNNPRSLMLSGGQPGPIPQYAPPAQTTIVIPSYQQYMPQPPGGTPPAGGAPGTAPRTNAPSSAASQDPTVREYTQHASEALAAGQTPQQIISKLQGMPGLSTAQKKAIADYVNANGPQRLPTGGMKAVLQGGSGTPASPFGLQTP